MSAAGVAEVRRVPAEALVFALWCAGALGFLAVQFGGYLAFRRRARRWSRPAGDYGGLPVRTCDAVDTPMLLGLLRPVILVPAGGADDFALLHEAEHARRRDLWYKLLLVLCNAVHWFNPLVWLLRRAAARDVEIACDAALLKGRDQEYRRAYGQALLRTVAAGRRPGDALTSAFSGGGKSLRQRFRALMDTAPKRAGRAALACLCAVALLAGTLVACGGGLEVPRNGTVYVNSDFDYLIDNGDGNEQVTCTVVDYDPEAGELRSEEVREHTFTMAEEVTVRTYADTAGGYALGTLGTTGRLNRLSNVLRQSRPSGIAEGSIWLLRLHLTDGKVDEMGWLVTYENIPAGDLYDEASGLYYCPELGMGTVIPAEAAEQLTVRKRVAEDGVGSLYFLDRRVLEAVGDVDDGELEQYALLTAARFAGGSSMLSAGRENSLPEDEALREGFRVLSKYTDAMMEQFFKADSVQILSGGEQDVAYLDSVSGARLTIPGKLADGLVVFSAATGSNQDTEDGVPVFTPDGGYEIGCFHREMLGQFTLKDEVGAYNGVFTLMFYPGREPIWNFDWAERYPWLKLSDGARRQCEGLEEAQANVAASLDTTVSELLSQEGVTGVEPLDGLPARDGVVSYENRSFGFSLDLPEAAAGELTAVTVDWTAWNSPYTIPLGIATLQAGSGVRERDGSDWTGMDEGRYATRAVTFVDRRLLKAGGDGMAAQVLQGLWAGRVVCAEGAEAISHLERVGAYQAYTFYQAPTLLTEEALDGAGFSPEERDGVLETAAEVERAIGAMKALPPQEEERSPLERFVPDGLTAIFDGPRENDPGDVVINWYRLRLTFHFEGTEGVDLNESRLYYRLEFEEDSALQRLMGINPFTGGGRVEGGENALSGAIDFTMGGNTMTEEHLRALVAEDPSCTLRVTDPVTGESRTFPMEARYQEKGGEVVYTLDASYDAATDTLSYRPIQVDERDMSFEEPGGAGEAVTLIGETVPLADGVRLIGGYGEKGDVPSFLESRVLFSTAPMGLRLTIVGGEITTLEWVRLTAPAVESAEARGGVVHEVDVEGGTVSGFWLDESGAIDLDAAFSLPVSEGSNIQLLDGEGRYGEPVGLKELEARILPLSSWGLACELSMLDGTVRGIVEAG